MKSFTIDINKVTSRDRWLGETTGTSVEGGACNANYRQVEAVAKVSNHLGNIGLEYGKDFYWEGFSLDELTISLDDSKIVLIEKLKWS